MNDFYYWFAILFILTIGTWAYIKDQKGKAALGEHRKDDVFSTAGPKTEIDPEIKPVNAERRSSAPGEFGWSPKVVTRVVLVWVAVIIAAFLCNFVWGLTISFIHQDSISRLIPGLETASTRTESMNELIRIGKESVLPLIDVLANNPIMSRTAAAQALGEIKDVRAVEPLVYALKDQDISVRLAAAIALVKFNDERAIDPLILAFQDNFDENRMAAAEALGHSGSTRALSPLAVVLENDARPEVRSAAALAIGTIGGEGATQPLRAALERQDLFVIAKSPTVFIAIGSAGDEPIFLKALAMYGDSHTATTYLNCGNRALIEAAELWAKNHGFKINPSYPKNSATWGSGN